MRQLRWSNRADRELKAYLARLTEASPDLAAEARGEIDAVLDLLTRHPGVGRPSLRWQAYREKSVRRWKKIIVFSITDRFLRVHAFLDARQDLERLRP